MDCGWMAVGWWMGAQRGIAPGVEVRARSHTCSPLAPLVGHQAIKPCAPPPLHAPILIGRRRVSSFYSSLTANLVV